MLKINTYPTTNGGPAFPHKPMKWDDDASMYVPDIEEHGRGMCLRDYFAAKAMAGFLAAPMGKLAHQTAADQVARDAYILADAMLVARDE
jgi:hypothetical protein